MSLYARFCRKLEEHGLPRGPAEGPRDFARRIVRPDLASLSGDIAEGYVALRYGGRGDLAAFRGSLTNSWEKETLQKSSFLYFFKKNNIN